MAWSEHCDKYGLTRQQAKIFDLLCDGDIHSKADIIANAFDGRFACDHLVPVHINRMRSILKGQGVEIVSVGPTRKFQGWQLRFEVAA